MLYNLKSFFLVLAISASAIVQAQTISLEGKWSFALGETGI